MTARIELKTWTDKQIKTAAYELCDLRGVNPSTGTKYKFSELGGRDTSTHLADAIKELNDQIAAVQCMHVLS